MTAQPWDAAVGRIDPQGIAVEVLGQSLRIHSDEGPEALKQAAARVEATFHDMEQAYRLRYGCPPTGQDTSTWLVLGALNLAHRIGRLEQEATQHTHDLEKTLSNLLDDDPLELPAPKPLLTEDD